MGMTRLAIVGSIPLDQPSSGCADEIISIFNGEIYNFSELREMLNNRGHNVNVDSSDASIIPHLFEEFGIDFVKKLRGMFAIVLWESKSQNCFLVRDSTGIKPLYFTIRDNQLIAASEIKAVFALTSKKFHISHLNLNSFVNNQMVYSPRTIWADIFSVPPGTHIMYEPNNSITVKRWNQSHYPRRCNKLTDTNKYESRLDTLLREAVKEQYSHGTTPAILLSGGLDSSLIAKYISELGHSVDSYHLHFENASSSKEDDRRHAEELANKLGFQHKEIGLTGETYFERLDECLDSFQQPFFGVTSMFFASKEISKLHKSCFTGDGADEFFGSYRRVRHFAKLHYSELAHNKQDLWSAHSTLEGLLNSKITKSDFVESTHEKLTSFSDEDFALKSVQDDFEGALMFDQIHLLPEQVLLYSDHLSMAHGLEIRPPFLSENIITFARSLPFELLINNDGDTKVILRKLAGRFFPEGFVYRRKEGFAIPLEYWLNQTCGKEWIWRNFTQLDKNAYHYLDRNKVREVIEEYLRGQYKDFFFVYRTIVLSRFLNRLEKR